jgi:hypothetical protein
MPSSGGDHGRTVSLSKLEWYDNLWEGRKGKRNGKGVARWRLTDGTRASTSQVMQTVGRPTRARSRWPGGRSGRPDMINDELRVHWWSAIGVKSSPDTN